MSVFGPFCSIGGATDRSLQSGLISTEIPALNAEGVLMIKAPSDRGDALR